VTRVSTKPVIYLRGGGTTYNYRSLKNRITVKDFGALDSKNLGHESKTSKTAVADKAARSGLHTGASMDVSSLTVGTSTMDSGYIMTVSGKVKPRPKKPN
jgi:hypothetical protein